ncbi:MAG: site-specific integrase [Anaerolineae bacterium]|nr:MAG: site-specific integrase [Anaerolineae bacterium]
MAKRRGNNEGSIHQRANGVWRAQVTLNGRRLNFTGQSRKECRAWIKETIQHIDQGFTFEGGDMTLEEFLNGWLVSIQASRSKATVALYQRTIVKGVLPFIGHLQLKDIKPDLIQRLYDHQIKNGQSNHAVRSVHKTLNSALMHALRLGMIIRNPCKPTTPPRLEHTEMQIYNEDQIQVLLNTALALNDQYYPVYYLAIHTGMRQSELIGLKWSDLDWEKRFLQVQRQLLRFKGGGFEFSRPKSRNGTRTIVLGHQAIEILRAHREAVVALQGGAGEGWTDLGMMFPTRVGTPILGSNLRRGFRAVLKASGLPHIRFHDLRHTAASLMLNHNIPVLVASRRLGHAKASITLDVYGHLIPSKQEEAAELMDELLTPVDVSNCTIFAPKQGSETPSPPDTGSRTGRNPHI